MAARRVLQVLRRILAVLAAAALPVMGPGGHARADGASFSIEHVRARLLAHAPEGVQQGKTFWLGLELTHQPQWHTYWKNPGDSGLPTELTWQLPVGLSAGEIAWPLPSRIPLGPLANYGYEGTVLLAVPVLVDAGFKPPPTGVLPIRVQATWLACKTECIPEQGELALQVPVHAAMSLHGAQFDAALAAQPRDLALKAVARVSGSELEVQVPGLPRQLHGRHLELFLEVPEVSPAGAPWTQSWKEDLWTATVPLSAQATFSGTLPLVLKQADSGWRIQARVEGAASLAGGQRNAAAESADRANADSGTRTGAPLGYLAALFGAMLGGLILNLMPCVFPVLAIKVVGFTRHGGDVRQHRITGLAYTAGVVLSFMALAGALLALRAAGEQLGWGFQLQSPAVVALLAALFALIGLNLAGVFEFGHILPSRIAKLQARHPAADSFLSGVLAVAVASPCTAPFMGASLGLAVGLHPAQALAVFAMLGLGMALPYLVASWSPAVARSLPRPGPWMDVFRRLMAFPMFATVVWLLWVLGQQVGIDGASALLGWLVLLSLLVWSVTLQGRARALIGAAALAGVVYTGWTGATLIAIPPGEGKVAAKADGDWQAWSPQQVQHLVEKGRPVFVDFTAAWCVTCQFNKKTTLADERVLDHFRRKDVATLRADWTRRDADITQELQRLGRSGVPVYVLHRPGREPVIFSEVLRPEEVVAALREL